MKPRETTMKPRETTMKPRKTTMKPRKTTMKPRETPMNEITVEITLTRSITSVGVVSFEWPDEADIDGPEFYDAMDEALNKQGTKHFEVVNGFEEIDEWRVK